MGFSGVESVFRMKFRSSKSKHEAYPPLTRPSFEMGREEEVSSYAVKALPTPPRSINSHSRSSSSEAELQSPRALSFSCTGPDVCLSSEVPRKASLNVRPLQIPSKEGYRLGYLALSPRPSTSHGRPPPDSSQHHAPLPTNVHANSKSKRESANGDEPGDYDLRPPPLRRPSDTVEGITSNLFSDTHLSYILNNRNLRLGFAEFLQKHRPSLVLPFVQYSENQKAVAAVMYANAIGAAQKHVAGALTPCVAATISSQFHRNGQAAFNILLSEALPAYITHELTTEVWKYQLDHIPNTKPPKSSIEGLSDVFCLSDPNQEDHPIIYASTEFFKMTQYGRDYAIGKNCRFLQGPGTSRESISRLRSAVQKGQEIQEVILNYRRDGSAFFNLLLMIPLLDDRGRVKYYLGAQIDVTGLVKEMSTLAACTELAARSPVQSQFSHLKPPTQSDCVPAQLRDLSSVFSREDLAILNGETTTGSSTSGRFEEPSIARARTLKHQRREHLSDHAMEYDDADLRQSVQSPTSPLRGLESLPGIYQRYLLVRPTPSLPILFASPAMQESVGERRLQQSPLFFNITASAATLTSIQKAFSKGTPNTSRIYWRCAPEPGYLSLPNRGGGALEEFSPVPREMDHPQGKLEMRWMSATPLVGSDDKIGVWMVVFV